MNIRKIVDYSELYCALDKAITSDCEQMQMYARIGKAVNAREEKGAAVAAAEYLQKHYPDIPGFSPRNLRRMREFWRTYGQDTDALNLAMLIGWTQNVVILEAELTMQERTWYLREVAAHNWSKKVLVENIQNAIHLNVALDQSTYLCYTDKENTAPESHDEENCVMEQKDKIQLFEDKRIRTAWNEEKEEWYFSIVDVVAVLTDQPDQRHAAKYWSVLKTRLKQEGSELPTNCSQLKMTATDGKRRLTDVADTEQLLRIIQSIPSPKAEPFKMWLAQVGRERIEETIDPELTIERALETYLKKGYTREWIHQRLQAIQVRKELTDEWDARGVKKGVEYAILTDEISRAWSGMSTRQYKNFKGLKKENLRDNMTTLELVLNMLAEATTTEISKQREPEAFSDNVDVARAGGKVAGDARKAIEAQTGVPVITSKNAAQLNQVVTNLIEGVVDDDTPEEE